MVANYPSIYCTSNKHSDCAGLRCICSCHEDWFNATPKQDVEWVYREERPAAQNA